MLQRFGGLDEQNISLEIDNLGAGPNKLLAVNDASGSPEGFSDGTNSGDDFAYDASGNMISDKNKNITSVAYNHLNLPVQIVFGGDLNTRVDYVYDALGAKLQKTVVQYNPVGDHSIVLTSVTDYLGFQYKDGVLQFFPTSEGYVSHTKGSYSYVYNYTDHLGNVRMSYAKNPASPSELKIIEENHYYPFGLKHQNYNSEEFLFDKKDSNLQLRAPVGGQILPFQYKYNGKEFQEELGLNWYDYGARNYDPAIGRWMNIDPKAETSRRWTPYNYAYNNPIIFVDPDGMQADDWRNKAGELVYDPNKTRKDGGKGDYTDYATKNDKTIGDALQSTDTGKEQFNKLVNSSQPTEIVVDNGFSPKGQAGKTDNGDPAVAQDMATGKVEEVAVKKSTITVYMGTVGKLADADKNGNVGKLNGTPVNGLTFAQVLGAVIGHEIEHTTIPNIILYATNATEAQYEKVPTQVSNKIIQESLEKNKKQ